MKTERYTWEGLLEDLAQGEQHYLEFKDSSFLNLSHPYNAKKSITTIDGLKLRLKQIITQYLSAFANGNGGAIVFGINDDGKFDSNQIELAPFGPKTSLLDWISNVARSSIQPPIESLDSYFLTNEKNLTVLLVSAGRSEIAPHQCALTKQYFVRSGSSTEAALHWQIEEIRNRKVKPKLELSLELRPKTTSVDAREQAINSITFNAHLTVKNVGTVMASKWGFSIETHFGNLDLPEPSFKCVQNASLSKGNKKYYYSNSPCFPSQELNFVAYLKAPVRIKAKNEFGEAILQGLGWYELNKIDDNWKRTSNGTGIDTGEAYILQFQIFADDAPVSDVRFEVADIKFETAVASFIRNNWGTPRTRIS
jgi:hypothetical protein